MDKQGIINYLKEHENELKNKYGVTKLGLFGSFANGNYTDNSDIDILVEIKSKNKFRSFFMLLNYLRTGLNKKIDLGIESALKPVVKKRVKENIIYVIQ